MSRYMLYVLLTVILLIGSITPVSAATPPPMRRYVESNHMVQNLAYSLQPVWETSVSGFYGNNINVFFDVDGDGIDDLLVEGIIGLNTTIVAVSGNSSIISILTLPDTQPYMGTVNAIDIVNDADNDGYPELVLYFHSIDFIENKTYIGFLTWQPVGNKLIANATYVFNDTQSAGMPQTGLVVEGDTASTIVNTQENTGNIPTFKAYHLYYNVLTGELTVDVESNIVYDIYTDVTFGDIDDDGVVELTKDYMVKAYTQFVLFPSPGLYSTVEVYDSNGLVFSKQLPANYIPFYITPNKIGNDMIYDAYCIQVDMLSNTTYARVVALSSSGSTVYDLSLGVKTIPLNAALNSRYILLTYLDYGNNVFKLAVIDNANGEVVGSFSNSMIFTAMSLGDVDGDGEYEFIYHNVTMYNILKIPSLEASPVLNTTNITSMTTVIAYEYDNGVGLIPALKSSFDGSIIGLYNVSTTPFNDTTPPEITIFYPINDTRVGRILYLGASVTDPESGVAEINITLLDEETGGVRSIDYNYTFGFITARITFNHSGYYDINITAKNNAGLVSLEYVRFYVDAEPPIIIVEYPSNNTVITPYDLPLNITFTVDDNSGSATWFVMVNNNTVSYGYGVGEHTVAVNKSLLVEGWNNITIYAQDEVFNPAVAFIRVKYVTGMNVSVSILNEGVLEGYLEGVINIQLLFQGMLSPGLYWFDVSVDDRVIYSSTLNLSQTYNVGLNTSLFSDGEHVLKIVMILPDGTNMTLYMRTIMIDNHAPTLIYEMPSVLGNIINSKTATIVNGKVALTIRYNVSDPNLAWFAIIVDGEVEYNASASAETLSLLALTGSRGDPESGEKTILLDEGRHNITMVGADKAGHKTVVEKDILVDITPPDITVFTAEVEGQTVTIYWMTSDNVTDAEKITIKIGEKTYEYTNRTGSLTLQLEPGNYTATITAVDAAGNTANKTITFWVKQIQGTTTTTTPTTPTQTTTTTTTTQTTTTTSRETTQQTQTTSSTTTTPTGQETTPITTIVVASVIIIAIIATAYFLKKK